MKQLNTRSARVRRGLAALVAVGTVGVSGGYVVAQFANPTASAPSQFVAIDAYRAIDTRESDAGRPTAGDIQKFPGTAAGTARPDGRVEKGTFLLELGTDLDGVQQIPNEAVAVTYTVTVAATTRTGFLSIGGIGEFTANTAALAWVGGGQRETNSSTTATFDSFEDSSGDELVVFQVDGEGDVATHVIIDVTGYYVPSD